MRIGSFIIGYCPLTENAHIGGRRERGTWKWDYTLVVRLFSRPCPRRRAPSSLPFLMRHPAPVSYYTAGYYYCLGCWWMASSPFCPVPLHIRIYKYDSIFKWYVCDEPGYMHTTTIPSLAAGSVPLLAAGLHTSRKFLNRPKRPPQCARIYFIGIKIRSACLYTHTHEATKRSTRPSSCVIASLDSSSSSSFFLDGPFLLLQSDGNQ